MILVTFPRMIFNMKKWTREELIDLELPWWGIGEIEPGIEVVEDRILNTGRWVIYKRLVFNYHGDFYGLNYQLPATEMQECDPFYGGEPICEQVFPVETKFIKYLTQSEMGI